MEEIWNLQNRHYNDEQWSKTHVRLYRKQARRYKLK